MAQGTLSAEPPETPPPIPLRSHLRNGSAYQLKLCAIKSGVSIMSNTSSSPASQILLEEIDHELADTRQRLHSAIIERRGMHGHEDLELWESQGRSDAGLQRDSGWEHTPGELYASASGSEVSYPHDHLDSLHPVRLVKKSEKFNGSSYYGPEECVKGAAEDVDVLRPTATQQGSHDSTTSTAQAIGLGITEDLSPSYQYSEGATDIKVVDWLARGFLSPSLSEVDSLKPDNGRSSRPFPSRHLALSLFPPKSPSTGNREYTPPGSPFARPICPMSPLNNGRDVYGNYIASNARDYLTAQSPPTSSDPRPIKEGQDNSAPDIPSPTVCLRGGGWGKFKPFWKTTSTEMSNQAPVPMPLHRVFSKDEIPQDVPTATYVGRPDRRVPPSTRSHLSGPRARADPRSKRNTRSELSAVDTRRYGVHGLDHRPGTAESADTNENSPSRADVDPILTNHFGPQPSRPALVSSENRPSTVVKQQGAYDRHGAPISSGMRPPPVDETPTPHSSRSKFASSNIEFSNYHDNFRQPPVSRRHTSWDAMDSRKTQEAASTMRSHKRAPRDEKRWNRDIPPPPPRLPPVQPLRYIQPESFDDSSSYLEDDSRRATSIISTNTVDDRFINLPGSKSSEACRKVQHDREVLRIEEQCRLYAEADRRREENSIREQEAQKQGPYQGTTFPRDNLTQVMRLRSLETRPKLECASALKKQRYPNSPPPSQYLPRHGPIPESFRCPKKTERYLDTMEHPSNMPAPASAAPSNVRKHHNSFRNVLSKAGKLSRLILTAPSDPRLETYSDRHTSANPTKTGLSADSSGWPSTGASSSREGFTTSRKVREEGDRPKMKRMEQVLEETQASETVVRDFAARSFRETNRSDEPAVSANIASPRSPGITQPQYLGYPRSGPRARPQHAGVSTPIASAVTTQPTVGIVTPCNAAGTPLYAFPEQPDNNGCLYIRRDDGEVLPFNPSLGYPYHMRLNNAYGIVRPDRITEEWLDGIVPNSDATDQPIMGIRGGASEKSPPFSPLISSETNTLVDQYRLLTTETLDDIFSSSSANLSFDSAAYETLLPIKSTVEDDARSSSDGENLRSSFGTDFAADVRREKQEREEVWRNEDDARAMALMHSFG